MGRLAGDEFAVFAEGIEGEQARHDQSADLARLVLTEIAKPLHLPGQEIDVTASIGVAFVPEHADNVIDLIRNADAAMYHAKRQGRNCHVFYVPEMNAAAVERLLLKSKLRRALERDEFVVRYQPKVDLASGEVVGAEALLRWRLPGHGEIAPSQFIPLAEESRLILDIGAWVLNQVCSDYAVWKQQVSDPGRIAINLSLKELSQASFIPRCRSVFERHKVAPSAVELEITETTLMLDAERTLPLLDELRAMGVHLSIDDFGTGYSSLSALQQFPISTLKIDRSFVTNAATDPDDATIVRTIIEMGRSLGLQVIAEGIETDEQRYFLLHSGCQLGQGRLFGEPDHQRGVPRTARAAGDGRTPDPAAAGLTIATAPERDSAITLSTDGAGFSGKTVTSHGRRVRAYRDVLAACLAGKFGFGGAERAGHPSGGDSAVS